MDYIFDPEILNKMPWLSEKRKEHIISTANTAKKIAMCFCPDKAEFAFVAGLFHDCAKGIEKELLNKYDIGIFKKFYPTSHAPLGALLAKDLFGISEPELLNAIKWHCTGKANMTDLEKIVFLADAIEPLREYDKVEQIRLAAQKSLDNGVAVYVDNLISYLSNGDESAINPYTFECYNFYRRLND